jgi:hypothetical protein
VNLVPPLPDAALFATWFTPGPLSFAFACGHTSPSWKSYFGSAES